MLCELIFHIVLIYFRLLCISLIIADEANQNDDNMSNLTPHDTESSDEESEVADELVEETPLGQLALDLWNRRSEK